MTNKTMPELFFSPLSGRIYCATRYTRSSEGYVTVQTKYDVTESFRGCVKMLAKHDRATKRRNKKHTGE